MKKTVFLGLGAMMSLVLLWGCGGKLDESDQGTATKQMASETGGQGATSPARAGTVAETMDTGGYTYVLVDNGTESVWVAAPEFEVEVGDQVAVPTALAMENYYSKTLDRTFDVVYFAEAVQVGGDGGSGAMSGGMPPGHVPVGKDAGSPPADVDLSGIEKAAGGMTVGEVWAARTDLGGKEVVVRGKVVKSLSGIMGKNWIHIQDGTGEQNSNDLTVTTDKPVSVGSLVLVKGVAAVDKDFGAGYFYPVIVEDAEVTVESE
jgi:hypothetical protein